MAHIPQTIVDNDWLPQALNRIAELAQLCANWDGYGSPPLQPAAVQGASELLRSLERFDLPVPQIAPVTGGGIGICWHVPPRRLEVEVLPGGSFEYAALTREPGGELEPFREAFIPPLDDAQHVPVQLVKWLIHG